MQVIVIDPVVRRWHRLHEAVLTLLMLLMVVLVACVWLLWPARLLFVGLALITVAAYRILSARWA